MSSAKRIGRIGHAVASDASLLAHNAEHDVVEAAKAAEHMAMLSVETIGSLSAVPTYVLLFSPVLSGILAVGLALVLARFAFLWMIPELIKVSGVLAFGMNWAIDALEIFEVIVSDTIDIILDIVDVFSGRTPDHVVSASIKWSDISAAQVRFWLKTVASSCTPYDSIVPILNATIKMAASSAVCPVIRSTQPMPAIGPATAAVLGWMSYDWDPNYGQNNCVPDQNSHVVLCSAFGAGYIALELLVPMLLGAILLVSMGPALLRLIATGLLYAAEVSVDATKIILRLLS